MTTKIACPRCGQDYLWRVELVALNRHAVLCLECDALWLNELDVAPPAEGRYGVTWFDYGTFMKQSGRPAARQEDEVKVLEPLTLDREDFL